VFTPSAFDDMFFDDIKTLYDLAAPESGRIAVEQIYSDHRQGERARLDSLSYLELQETKVVDLDTGRALPIVKDKSASFVTLDVPIKDEKQSAHLKLTGTLKSPGYTVVRDELVFQRTLKGLRNTIVLPKGWEVSGLSQSGTIGTDRNGREQLPSHHPCQARCVRCDDCARCSACSGPCWCSGPTARPSLRQCGRSGRCRSRPKCSRPG
jgi:hypothetical protein